MEEFSALAERTTRSTGHGHAGVVESTTLVFCLLYSVFYLTGPLSCVYNLRYSVFHTANSLKNTLNCDIFYTAIVAQ